MDAYSSNLLNWLSKSSNSMLLLILNPWVLISCFTTCFWFFILSFWASMKSSNSSFGVDPPYPTIVTYLSSCTSIFDTISAHFVFTVRRFSPHSSLSKPLNFCRFILSYLLRSYFSFKILWLSLSLINPENALLFITLLTQFFPSHHSSPTLALKPAVPRLLSRWCLS